MAYARAAAPTAEWLSQHLAGAPQAAPRPALPPGARIDEFQLPMPQDLAHDVAIDSMGRVIVTGMFSHEMLVLDTDTKTFSSVPIPVNRANPRAVEVDARGNWWVVLGSPNAVARYSPLGAGWKVFEVGMHAHSVAIDTAGNAWVNGHFTSKPVRVSRVGPDGSLLGFDLLRHPVLSDAPGGPIPYEIRTAPNGTVWVSELSGNRIVSLDPATRRTKAYDMPVTHSGPRRFDIDKSGVLWIPAYANNEIVRFDPATETFTRHALPIRDALPYVVRVDPRTGRLWIGSGSADVVFSLDPSTSHFTTYPLPSRGAMVRHLAIDSQHGDVWIAYGASPGRIPSRIARLRLQ